MELGRVYIRYGISPGDHYEELENDLNTVLEARGFFLEAGGYDEFVGARCLTYKSRQARVGMTTMDQIKSGEFELPKE